VTPIGESRLQHELRMGWRPLVIMPVREGSLRGRLPARQDKAEPKDADRGHAGGPQSRGRHGQGIEQAFEKVLPLRASGID
jgi:hypothetical protein